MLMFDRKLTGEQLYTLLTEVESILNNRPLTHVSDDPSDLDALTPNHLLLGMHRKWEFVASVSENEVDTRRKWRQVQALARVFWDRWLKEYVPCIIKRHKWATNSRDIVMDELVLLTDDEMKKKVRTLGRLFNCCLATTAL